EMFYSPSGDVNCSNFVYGSRQNYWVFGISDTTVNIVDNSLESIIVKIYPNPVKSLLNIDFPNDYNIHNTIIEIVDINGRTILKSEPVSITSQLDIKKINSGLYLVKIQNKNTLITKRIIIQ
ncbi:MAG: T9SS type A sorting domain-containing protein, partial [Bacteroidota bacterium]|nr:T9SS type A sorting domain-containing protein [Bacteroidota bacterium]